MSVQYGLLVTLEAKPGAEDEVAKFLEDGLGVVEQEPETITWYATRLGPSTFGIFDTFQSTGGRDAHLSGDVAVALGEIADKLLSSPPEIVPVEIIAAKGA